MADLTKAGAPFPLNLGRCVDLYHDVRELRLLMEKEVGEIEAREKELREHIVQNLAASNDGGAVGLRYMARRITKTKFKFASPKTDANEAPIDGTAGWGLFTSWVRKNDAFHFLQKRMNDTAVAEMLHDEGRLPPGIDKFDIVDISVTKAS